MCCVEISNITAMDNFHLFLRIFKRASFINGSNAINSNIYRSYKEFYNSPKFLYNYNFDKDNLYLDLVDNRFFLPHDICIFSYLGGSSFLLNLFDNRYMIYNFINGNYFGGSDHLLLCGEIILFGELFVDKIDNKLYDVFRFSKDLDIINSGIINVEESSLIDKYKFIFMNRSINILYYLNRFLYCDIKNIYKNILDIDGINLSSNLSFKRGFWKTSSVFVDNILEYKKVWYDPVYTEEVNTAEVNNKKFLFYECMEKI